jgi:acyl phosphate:glycerol-3-phosphate acyltransferase
MSGVFHYFSLPLLLTSAYLVGSIPFAQVLARINGVDLRKVGTGNVGAGNLTRSVGRSWGILAAILDGLKGLIPVLVARQWMHLGLAASGMAGLAAVVGHNWSIFMKGRSGRGLAPAAGLIVALDPILAVWVGGWSVAGWKIGGGFAGFFGWGLLPLASLALGRPVTETVFLVFLSAVLVGRRMQGNPGDLPGLQHSLRRAIFDTDLREDFGQTVDETTGP